MTCELCLQESKLCDSHIIPEFAFRPTYDETGRAVEIRGERAKKLQKGYREKLLCPRCEDKLNEGWEKYFKEVWFDRPALPVHPTEGFFTIEGLAYRRFKLFHLSVLWRASVAQGDPFRKVKLPAEDEEQLRRMLEADNPGPVAERLLHDVYGQRGRGGV